MENRDYVDTDLPAIISLCIEKGWSSFADDPARAHRALTAQHKRSSGYRIYPPFT